MDHLAAEALLEDWVEGRLAADRASEVEAHVGGCAECAAHADLLRDLRREVAAHGEALFTPHLSSDELARLELRVDSLSIPEAARLGAHVRACPRCTAEARLIRSAARPAPLRALAAWLEEPAATGAWLRPALAMAVVLLAWPAWLGLVEYPRARRAADRARAAAERVAATPGALGGATPGAGAPTPGAAASPWSGGGAGVLILSGPTRGAGEALPEARLHPGQPGLTIVTDRRLDGTGPVRVTLRDAKGNAIWQTLAAAGDLWDARARVTSLMIPSAALAPGEYALSIGTEPGAPAFEARFRIVP